MRRRVSTSAHPAPARRRRLSLALAGLILLLGGAEAARRAAPGHGGWRELARSVYHSYRDFQLQRAYAAQARPERAEAALPIYAGRLGDGWQDWSWATHALGAPRRGDHAAISIHPAGYKGVYLHHDALGTTGYGVLRFYVYGRPALNVCAVDAGGTFLPAVPLDRYAPAAAPGRWVEARVPLAALGVPRYGGFLTGVVFQAAGAAPQPPAALADVALLPDPALPPSPTHATVAVRVDLTGPTRPISPLIYGMAFAPPSYVADLRLPLNRWGGNDKSRYNWVQGNADNAARDWHWANRPAWATPPGAVRPGPSSAADAFVRDNGRGGARTLLTVPTLGWVARDADNAHRSEGVPGGGGDPLAGPDGPIAGYDPAANRARTSVRSLPRRPAGAVSQETVYQDEWVRHLCRTFGDAHGGGVAFYAMDNEPDLWDVTHTDVHPARMGYDDLLRNFLDYAGAVKDADPTALVTGPVLSGWSGYFYSPLDRGADNFHTHADRARHGGEPFLPWFLRQVRAHDVRAGRRTLDVLDVHYYPQGPGLFGGATDPDARARRLRATRSLWDPGYTDESWIGEPVRLLPRLQEWIAQDYPGTRLGITEWNFGADGDMSGALAIADVLGLYGQEGVFLADYWAFPAQGSPGYLAFKLYRNADGRGHGFGDTALRAVSADPGRVACYAARDGAGGALTLMLINKMPRATVDVPLTLAGAPAVTFAGGAGLQGWRLAADNPKQIVALPASALGGGASPLRLPPYSITLLRMTQQPTTTESGLTTGRQGRP